MIGDLVQTSGGRWIDQAPKHCSSGHRLGPGQVLVGHTACVDGPGGHLTWMCRECDQTVYGPPLGPNCTVIDGPAAVRISNR